MCGTVLPAATSKHSRQKPDDSYDLGEVIRTLRSCLGDVPIVTDDNYAAAKVMAVGCQLGADLTTFSCFKLLGPEGVGAVVGRAELVERVRELQYSGGSQVQGHEAMAALRGYLREKGSELDKYKIFVLQADCQAAADGFVADIKAQFPAADVVVQPVGPVIGSHCGPGTIGLIFHAKER